ncbi:hypothetical protein Adt_40012 [Abeliophyllum distichum]|uniref:Uncharacterized protein n=1 Tax=Abeliophyllum distichum TaxID=126358 RepID=A0ABD1Q6P7_9LAMI
MEISLHVFQTMYQLRKLPKKKGKDDEPRWHRCLIELGLMAMDKEKLPRPALARLSKQKPRALTASSSEEVRQKKALEDMSREGNKEAVEASKVIEVDDSSAPEGYVPLSRKRKLRAPRSGTGAPQGSVEIVDDYATCSAPPLQRTLAVNTSGEVVLEAPPRLSRKPGGAEWGPYESKRRLRELIGVPGARIPDDVLQNVPFYPSMGALGCEEVLHTQVGRVFFSWRMGRRAGGQFGFCDKSLGNADESSGRVQDTYAGVETA